MFPLELPIQLAQLAPMTALLLLIGFAAVHGVKTVIQERVRRYMDAERQNYELSFEVLKHRHQRPLVGYEMWMNRVFDVNTELFGAVSRLHSTIRVLDEEQARIATLNRADVEHYLQNTYGESDEVRRICTFWHSDHAGTLQSLDAHLTPLRLERARQAARTLREFVCTNELFISEVVIKLVEEVIAFARCWSDGGELATANGTRAVDWLAQRQRQVRAEIVKALSDHAPAPAPDPVPVKIQTRSWRGKIFSRPDRTAKDTAAS